MAEQYYAHGKLLLTGEYLVLDGAMSLALPTRLGQRMEVKFQPDNKLLHWKSKDNQGNIWLEGYWDIQQQKWTSISHPENSSYLEKLLVYASDNLKFNLSGCQVETNLEFPNDWGLGSSSTLIALLAQWWKADPYELLKISFGGSGYDIACANSSSPILYQIYQGSRVVKNAKFDPVFRDKLAFLYLGKKQNSREGIQHYRAIQSDKKSWIKDIDKITTQILECTSLQEFEILILRHEAIISQILQIPTVQSQLFSDYQGVIKSLGAWGGDFVLLTMHDTLANTQSYFKKMGYDVCIPYVEMVLEE
ncbi:MAG: GYDIA family GHMP kinase [Chitinophagales bacterium]|nr:GYDIA family GHMP kinase [Chitinophagales bacterium]